MLAGGTGIAPMYQVAQALLKNTNDKTEVSFSAFTYKVTSPTMTILPSVHDCGMCLAS